MFSLYNYVNASFLVRTEIPNLWCGFLSELGGGGVRFRVLFDCRHEPTTSQTLIL